MSNQEDALRKHRSVQPKEQEPPSQAYDAVRNKEVEAQEELQKKLSDKKRQL